MSIFNYFREAREELNKVTWLTRKQALHLTVIVIVITIILTIYAGTLDWFFTWSYEQLINFLSR